MNIRSDVSYRGQLNDTYGKWMSVFLLTLLPENWCRCMRAFMLVTCNATLYGLQVAEAYSFFQTDGLVFYSVIQSLPINIHSTLYLFIALSLLPSLYTYFSAMPMMLHNSKIVNLDFSFHWHYCNSFIIILLCAKAKTNPTRRADNVWHCISTAIINNLLEGIRETIYALKKKIKKNLNNAAGTCIQCININIHTNTIMLPWHLTYLVSLQHSWRTLTEWADEL